MSKELEFYIDAELKKLDEKRSAAYKDGMLYQLDLMLNKKLTKYYFVDMWGTPERDAWEAGKERGRALYEKEFRVSY